MGKPNDTTTELYPGLGGSKMDESLVRQDDQTTLAHRPRTVQGFDDGRRVGYGDGEASFPTYDAMMLAEARKTNELLEAIFMLLKQESEG